MCNSAALLVMLGGWMPCQWETATGTPSPTNDHCENPLRVDDGHSTEPFDLRGATLDSWGIPCEINATADIWFKYYVSNSGRVLIDTCDTDHQQASTSLVAYQGCNCDQLGDVLDCSGPSPERCLTQGSPIDFFAVAGECILLRVLSHQPATTFGQLSIFPPRCHGTPLTEPTTRTVDARRPHLPDDPSLRLGIDTIFAWFLSGGTDTDCWHFVCETAISDSQPNGIEEVLREGMMHTVQLRRAITLQAVTRLHYVGGYTKVIELRFHPGDVDANGHVYFADLHRLLAIMNGFYPGNPYNSDIDWSGMLTPLDLLDWIDLHNGADAYEPWGGTHADPWDSCPD